MGRRPAGGPEISIHALREEGDLQGLRPLYPIRNFYPRPPRGGRRQQAVVTALRKLDFYPRPPRGGRRRGHTHAEGADRFLSTPSARRATGHCNRCSNVDPDFYPRPPRGGRRAHFAMLFSARYFYPRPPRGGRRNPHAQGADRKDISIHALREEGDQWSAAVVGWLRDFYPHPPRGGRPPHPAGRLEGYHFYPRPPRGGRHLGCSQMSIHKYFYPRPPRGGRPAVRLLLWSSFNFYPRPPRGGRPFSFMYHVDTAKDFYPRPPRGGRPE